MTKSDYRYIYIGYLIVVILTALWLNNKYKLSDTPQNTASLIANTSELLGLAIALTEIFILSRVTDRIKRSIENLQSYSDISNVSIFLSQTKDDLIGRKYGKAILRLEKVRDVYQESLPASELENTTSVHRINFDKLNSIISTLTMAENSFGNLPTTDLQEFVTFLTSFNETLTSLKMTFKNSIL
ncbi:hypothetical protein COR50_17380 [Chitinophaga caeni]|uniref:Uncharacterized protein n=1 Tax=Chitinophaga caeni TaxID=2029983 RepID=A0A291QY35_9BACT|nr:hypothetical protein [Chitinophaga caeni]ATL48792.1 hypothetical protein COR50_17380 [Chitinophaga caeni]